MAFPAETDSVVALTVINWYSKAVTAFAPVVGITGRRFPAASLYPANTEALEKHFVDSYFCGYSEAVMRAGGTPIHLARVSDPPVLLEVIDGLVISGGLDIDPAISGAPQVPTSTGSDIEADRFEIALLRAALDRGVPILGICRGHELLNVALGGTVLAEVGGSQVRHNDRSVAPSTRAHSVRFDAGSELFSVYGPEVDVNSFHHQAIDTVGKGLTIVGYAEDGTPEAVEHESGDAVGVQWHPEMHAERDPIFGWLLERIRSTSGPDDRRAHLGPARQAR